MRETVIHPDEEISTDALVGFKEAQKQSWAHFAPLADLTTVQEIIFDRARMLVPTLSPQHSRARMELTAGPVIKLVESLTATDPARLAAFRREYEALVADYIEDNVVRQGYLMTRATKV